MATRSKKQKITATSARQIPGRQLTCRVRHPWPYETMQETKVVPVGVWTQLIDAATDLWKLFDRCSRCGKIRWRWMPGRRWVSWEKWHYIDPEDWVKMKTRFTRGDAQEENFNRNAAKLFASGGEMP